MRGQFDIGQLKSEAKVAGRPNTGYRAELRVAAVGTWLGGWRLTYQDAERDLDELIGKYIPQGMHPGIPPYSKYGSEKAQQVAQAIVADADLRYPKTRGGFEPHPELHQNNDIRRALGHHLVA